jgi:hypothetical protein
MDPGEQENVAEVHRDTVDRLKTVLESFLQKPSINFPKSKSRLDKETLEQLKDLGYIR